MFGLHLLTGKAVFKKKKQMSNTFSYSYTMSRIMPTSSSMTRSLLVITKPFEMYYKTLIQSVDEDSLPVMNRKYKVQTDKAMQQIHSVQKSDRLFML